jgi:hypothetical protein
MGDRSLRLPVPRGEDSVSNVVIVFPLKIVIWLAVIKLYTNIERWSFSLGLGVAAIFTVFDCGGFCGTWAQAVLFAGYWCVASVTLWGFVRWESLLSRIVVMSIGSFLLIMGPFLIPYPLRAGQN